MKKKLSLWGMVGALVALSIPALAWLTTDAPVAGFTGIADGAAYSGSFGPTTVVGYAHKGLLGLSQGDANARMSYYTIDACRDVDGDNTIGTAEIERGMAFRTVARVSTRAVGYDCASVGCTDGTPGDLLNGTVVKLGKGTWLLRVRAVDANGNTSTEVGGIDQYAQQGAAIAVTEDGNATYGWSDAEVIRIVVN